MISIWPESIRLSLSPARLYHRNYPSWEEKRETKVVTVLSMKADKRRERETRMNDWNPVEQEVDFEFVLCLHFTQIHKTQKKHQLNKTKFFVTKMQVKGKHNDKKQTSRIPCLVAWKKEMPSTIDVMLPTASLSCQNIINESRIKREKHRAHSVSTDDDKTVTGGWIIQRHMNRKKQSRE